MPCEFLLQGYQPAVPGTMRHIPARRIASNPSGIATWQAAGFIVDVGEIDLARYRQSKIIHQLRPRLREVSFAQAMVSARTTSRSALPIRARASGFARMFAFCVSAGVAAKAAVDVERSATSKRQARACAGHLGAGLRPL